jgi:hypothetical protein
MPAEAAATTKAAAQPAQAAAAAKPNNSLKRLEHSGCLEWPHHVGPNSYIARLRAAVAVAVNIAASTYTAPFVLHTLQNSCAFGRDVGITTFLFQSNSQGQVACFTCQLHSNSKNVAQSLALCNTDARLSA